VKILIAHNYYRSASPSGENSVVDEEILALRNAGIDVVTLAAHSDTIASSLGRRAQAAVGPIFAPPSVRAFRELVERNRPDVVHIHNVFPLISPAVVRVAQQYKIPVIQTVHNYRHSCVKGTRFRDGHPCSDCVGRNFPTPAVQHSCYRGSRAQSFAMAFGQAVHRNTWNSVAAFLCVSRFQAGIVAAAGLDPARIYVKPNAVPDPGVASPPGRHYAFVGRLDHDKGIDLLLKAWTEADHRGRILKVIGDGPLRTQVARHAQTDPSVRFLGKLEAKQVSAELSDVGTVVIPSLWPEPFGRVAAEAMATGRPIICTDVGALPEVVGPAGWICKPTVAGVAAALAEAQNDTARRQLGKVARDRYERRYSPLVVHPELLRIYEQVSSPLAPELARDPLPSYADELEDRIGPE
jgi:glycosyltransferase involved in cell wall biosynthesis